MGNNDQKFTGMYESIMGDMKQVVVEFKNEVTKTQSAVDKKVSDITLEINGLIVQIQTLQQEQGPPGMARTAELTQQIVSINKLQQNFQQRLDQDQANITSLQNHIGGFIAASIGFEQQIEELRQGATEHRARPSGPARIVKEKTLLDPKYMQVRHLTEKVCTARGVLLKWRRTLDTYLNSFFPQVDTIFKKVRTMTWGNE